MRRMLFFLGLSLFLNFYVFNGVKYFISDFDSRTSLWFKIGYWVLIGASYAALIFSITQFRTSPTTFWTKATMSFFFILFVIQLIWAIFMGVDDLVRLVQWVIGLFSKSAESAGTGISRKSFIMKTGAFLATGFGAALTYGVVRGSHRYQVVRQKLTIPGLPESMKGLKLVQISDIHSGSFWNVEGVQKGVELIKNENPDLVFFTGDIVNNVASEMEPYIDTFSQIKAKHGVYSIMGNHDYGEYVPGFRKDQLPENKAAIADVHKRLGWDLLLNENRILDIAGEKLAVVGIENWGSKMHFSRYGDLHKAMEGVDQNWPTLLLSHDPSHWRAQVLKEFPMVNAMFSGHTHGMQFGIETGGWKWSPVKYVYPEWAGMYEENNQKLYVNRGFGYLGFPGRLGIWPEITVFELA